MRPKRFRLTLAATLALAAPWAVHAQSLQELYDAARGYDATFLAAKALADSAQYKAEQSEALGRPSASLSASGTHTQINAPMGFSGGTNSVGATLNGRFPLFNKDNTATIEQSRKALIVSKADLESAAQDLTVRLAQAYFDVLASQDSLAATRANKIALTEQLASAKRNFEVGTATITDTREVQARYDLATAQELQAENDLLTKRIALDTLVGRQGLTPKPLITPVTLPPPVPGDPEAWVSTAETVHPTLLKAKLGLEVAQLETEKAKAGELPTLDAVGSAGATNTNGFGTTLPGVTKSASIGVQLNWPLYTGGAVQNRIKETLSLEEKAREDLEAARRAIGQSTRVAYYGVVSGLSQVKALEAAEASSKLALEATQLGYKVGVRVNLDVLNAQLQLFQTQRDLAKARYDVLVGGLKLRQASGQLVPGDIEAVNRLLAK